MKPKSLALLHNQREFPIVGRMVVGRSPDCNLVLAEDPKVSRMHARVLFWEGSLVVEDLQSANGVFVNGKRIHERSILYEGDELRLGSQRLQVVECNARRHAPTLPEMQCFQPNLASPFDEPKTEGSLMLVGPKNWEPLRMAIASEDLDRAAVLLRIAFDRVTDRAVSKGQLEQESQENLCDLVFALTAKTHQGVWLNMLFHLHMLVAKPLPQASVAMLPQLIHGVRGLDPQTLDAYVQVLRASGDRLTPLERQLCAALESARHIVSLQSR